MKNLIIVGARGWGREVFMSAVYSPAYYRDHEFKVKGFLDSDSHLLDNFKGQYPPIIGDAESYQIEPDDVFFIAMGDSYWRHYYADLIEKKGGSFYTIICDGAFVNPTARIGEGSLISAWSLVSANVKLGKHNIMHTFVNVGHDVTTGDFVSLESYSFVGGRARIGDRTIMHVRSTLISGKALGDDVVVGAQSVVMRNVSNGIHVFGNPAHKIEY